jgi:[ribosomal protein S5]-alanine N-acetyltransferase
VACLARERRIGVNNPFLIGTKIYLRAMEKEDAAALAAGLSDPDVRRTLNSYQPMSLAAEEDFIARARQNEHDLTLGIVVKESDKIIGGAGLHRIDCKNRHACFGIYIGDKAEWGKGYGSEAARLMVQHGFETLNLNRIWLIVFEYNSRGIRAYENIGFKREAILRQEVFNEGRYWNAYLMAMLREEWSATKDQGGC